MSSDRHRFEFRMPDPGEGLTEAELDAWLVAPGDEVTEADVLCEVETDKAIVEIPVPCDGEVVELRADPGDVVAVGEVIAVFETENPPGGQMATGQKSGEPDATTAQATDDATTAQATDGVDGATASTETGDERGEEDVEAAVSAVEKGADTAEADAETASTTENDERVFAAPSTRRYAREQGINISTVDGSGPGGRVLRADIDERVDSQSATPTGRSSTAPGPAAVDGETATDTDKHGEVVRRPLRGLRATIAENMVESERTIPHVTSMFEADATDLVDLKEGLDAELDAPVSYTALAMKAVVSALEAYPALNASVDEQADEIVEKHYYNIGVATHTEDGLVVPVVKDVDEKSIAEISTEVADLAARARQRSVDASDLGGGTFTVTNTGSHSEHGTFGTPIIRHPEVAILGMARVQRKPVAVGDNEMAVRPVLPLSLSYDHRLVDGVTASQFAEHVIEAIEDRNVFTARL